MKPDAGFPYRFQEGIRAFHIRRNKGRGIRNRIVVVTFRGKMHAGVGFGKEFHRQVRVPNVTTNKREMIGRKPFKIRKITCVSEFIQHRDMPPWVHEYPVHKVGTDESRAARDDQPLNFRHSEPLLFGARR